MKVEIQSPITLCRVKDGRDSVVVVGCGWAVRAWWRGRSARGGDCELHACVSLMREFVEVCMTLPSHLSGIFSELRFGSQQMFIK